MKLLVNEIFESLQGEGARAGSLNVFVRLSNCNLACNFCDTEFVSSKEIEVYDLANFIKNKFKSNWIIWTGGEPALQLNDEIVKYFKEQGFKQAIETNGTMPVSDELDWIVVSPKVAVHIVEKNFKRIDELRLIINSFKLSLPEFKNVKISHKYISPAFKGDVLDRELLQHCIELIKEHTEWKLSIQLHKILGIA